MFNKIKKIINEKIKKYTDPKNKNYIREDELKIILKNMAKYVILNDEEARLEFKKMKKGKTYEQFVGEYFEKQKFQVLYNGIHKGINDNKIDLIAIRHDIIYLIQCKNWNTNKYKINLKYIKTFMYHAIKWIEDNNIKSIPHRCLIVMNKPLLDKEAYKYIKNNEKYIEYKILPFNEH